MNEHQIAAAKTTIDIMLVSHTNAGKTTLVRTLLGKDVGEVLDAPDTTTAVAAHDLIVGEDGEALCLWDTPGFGDSFRLAKRLERNSRSLSLIVREIWDRYRNPRLWRGQRVAMDLKKRADVILYLVNTVERPVDAVYVAPELSVLAWVGKPVLAVLNQSGEPQGPGDESASVREWREALAGYPVIRKVLVLDSYTRCWVQELILYDEIGHVLPQALHAAYERLAQAMEAGHQQRFDASIHALADYLLRMATDKVELAVTETGPIRELWELIRNRISWRTAQALQPHEVAMESLAQRFMDETTAVTDKLIGINHLTGVSTAEIVEIASEKFAVDAPVDASKSALAGGVISGALTGLGADLLAGGLTLGTGALVGAVLGAVGAAALARGYNLHTDKGNKIVAWSPESLNDAFTRSVLLYLAIAHFGRGQGQWRRKDDPGHWHMAAADVANRYHDRLLQLWARASSEGDSPQTRQECASVLRLVLVELLNRLYPETSEHMHSTVPR
jgi:Domain of unknown function (DUF3482)/50S ribosome-binding GTPase